MSSRRRRLQFAIRSFVRLESSSTKEATESPNQSDSTSRRTFSNSFVCLHSNAASRVARVASAGDGRWRTRDGGQFRTIRAAELDPLRRDLRDVCSDWPTRRDLSGEIDVSL